VTSLKLREISDRTGIPMPTAFRVVATLEEGGYLERLPDGSIRPGVAVLLLGSAALRGSSLVQLSEQPLRHLAEQSGETVNLGVLVGDQGLFELLTLVGYYGTLALQLRVFRVGAPAG